MNKRKGRGTRRLHVEPLESRRLLSADLQLHRFSCGFERPWDSTVTTVVNDEVYLESDGKIYRVDARLRTAVAVPIGGVYASEMVSFDTDIFFQTYDKFHRYDTLTGTQTVFDIDVYSRPQFVFTGQELFFHAGNSVSGVKIVRINLSENQLYDVDLGDIVSPYLVSATKDAVYFNGTDGDRKLRRFDVVTRQIEAIAPNLGASSAFAAGESDIFLSISTDDVSRIVRYETHTGEITWMDGPVASSENQIVFNRHLYLSLRDGGPLRAYGVDGAFAEFDVNPISPLVPFDTDIYFIDDLHRLMRLDTRFNEIRKVEVGIHLEGSLSRQGDLLYLAGTDAEYGTELRQFDPLSDKLSLVADAFAGPMDGLNPGQQQLEVQRAGGALFFHAWSLELGSHIRQIESTGESFGYSLIEKPFGRRTCFNVEGITAHADGLIINSGHSPLWYYMEWVNGRDSASLGGAYGFDFLGSLGDTFFYNEWHGDAYLKSWHPIHGKRFFGSASLTAVLENRVLRWRQDLAEDGNSNAATGQWLLFDPITETFIEGFSKQEMSAVSESFVSSVRSPDVEFLYFSASSTAAGNEVRRMDLATGEVVTFDVMPGSESSLGEYEVMAAGADFFFVAKHPSAGNELHRIDVQGTLTTFDINPGEASSAPSGLVALDGDLYFTAVDPDHGAELRRIRHGESTWSTMEVLPGSVGANPHLLTSVRDELFFVATDVQFGSELRRWNPKKRNAFYG